MPSSGLVHITTTSFSAVSAVNIDSCFSATYDHYMIKPNVSGSAATVQVQMRVGGVTATSSVYGRNYIAVDGGSASGGRSGGQVSWSPIAESESGYKNWNEWWIYLPFRTVNTNANIIMGSNFEADTINFLDILFMHDTAISYDGFRVTLSTGTITGDISVFGLVLS